MEKLPGAVSKNGVRFNPPCLQRRRDGERLQGRAWFKFVSQRPVTGSAAFHVFPVIGVVNRQVDEGQNLARLCIQNNNPSSLCLIDFYRLLQFPVGQILDFTVDGQGKILPGFGARYFPTSSTIRPFRSLMTRRLPGLPASSSCQASSDPSCPLSSTSVKPSKCAVNSPGWVIATEFAFQKYTRYIKSTTWHATSGDKCRFKYTKSRSPVADAVPPRRPPVDEFPLISTSSGWPVLFSLFGCGAHVLRTRPY